MCSFKFLLLKWMTNVIHTTSHIPFGSATTAGLKAAGEKDTITYQGVPIRLSADFSKETLQARRGWKEVFQVMKSKDLQPRLLYLAKLKCFPGKVKLKEFIITQPLLYEILKGLI